MAATVRVRVSIRARTVQDESKGGKRKLFVVESESPVGRTARIHRNVSWLLSSSESRRLVYTDDTFMYTTQVKPDMFQSENYKYNMSPNNRSLHRH